MNGSNCTRRLQTWVLKLVTNVQSLWSAFLQTVKSLPLAAGPGVSNCGIFRPVLLCDHCEVRLSSTDTEELKFKERNVGHGDRVGGLAWHPQATLTQSPDAVNLVSGAGDFNIHLWSLSR